MCPLSSMFTLTPISASSWEDGVQLCRVLEGVTVWYGVTSDLQGLSWLSLSSQLLPI